MLTAVSINAQEVAYTLTPQKGSNNSYAGNCNIEIDGITWNLTGNSTMIPWRMGGKSLTAVDRTLYSKTAMDYAVDKVVLSLGKMSSITVNSAKLLVADNADFTNATETSFTAKASTDVEIPVNAAAGSYYKFVFNVTVSVDSNKFIEISKAVFYKAAGSAAVTAKPTFSPSSCTFEESLEVTISAEEGATIYYTVDGTEPTTESNEYAEALTIEETTTVKAIAVLNDVASSVATAEYTKLEAKTIAEVIEAGAGTAYTTGTVVATYNSGFLMGDETGHILVYQGKANIGDVVKVKGTTSKYAGLLQFGAGSTVENTGTTEVTYPEVTVMDGAAMDAYLASPYVKYVEYTGVLTISGNYYNVAIDDATTAQGSISYPAAGLVTANSGETVKVTGYTIGVSSSKYVNTMAVKVEKIEKLEALEAASIERNPLETAINGQYKLQGVKINFNEVVKKYTTDLTGDYGYILDAEGNEVAKLNKCMGGNGTSNDFATPYSATAIETPGTYKVVVLPGVIFNADGTKEYKGGEFEFTVAERAVEISPSAEEGFCWNETYENVADFSEFVITVKYAKSDVVINNDVKATMTTGETVYEATVTVEKSGNTQYITLAFNGEFAEGKYSINVPAGLFTVDGVANEEYAQSTFTYKKPQLEITRDFDTWESYLDQVWYMPKGAIITIANAESVEVDETKVATIAVGESVYKSTLSYYYDDLSNAHYIELTFEDFYAEGFEFVKGDYTFTLPAGLYTVNGVANEEVVKTYTYGDPIVEEFTVTEVLPAPGSTLESLDAISITFSNGMKPDMLPITCGEKTYYFIYMQGLYVAVDLMSYEPIVITEPGTYTLDLSELEGLTGDKVFTWTIAEAVEPEPEPTPGEVDYTPSYTGTVERYDRNVTAVTLNDNRYDLLTDAQSKCYVDATETVTFTVVAGSTLKAAVEHKGEWVHHSVYIDFEGDGFTSGLEEGSEWKPAGDLVAYSFYNNGGEGDAYGWNSVGQSITGDNRNNPEIPEFTAPTEPGLYRIRFVQDWCSINPNGDSDGKFGDFMGNGGQIIDVMLEVTVADGISEVVTEATKTIYDLTGRKIETITKPGIYIVGGKKVLVK